MSTFALVPCSSRLTGVNSNAQAGKPNQFSLNNEGKEPRFGSLQELITAESKSLPLDKQLVVASPPSELHLLTSELVSFRVDATSS